MPIKYLIIVNKSANDNKTQKIWPQIKAFLDQRHVNYVATASKYHKNAILITEEYVKQATPNEVLLVIGGDGTLNEVINSVKKITSINSNLPTLPIGYVPTGKRNNFAKNHHISLDWQKTLSTILNQGHSHHDVTIGYVNEGIKHQRIYFLNNVGIGLNADLINILHQSKVSWRTLRYFMAIFSLLYNLQSFTMEIYHPNKTDIYRKTFLANISLTTDPRHPFSLTIIKRTNLLIMFYIFFRLLLKKPIKLKSFRHPKLNQLHFGIPTLEYGHVDGEELGDRFYDVYFHTTKYPFI